MCTHALEAVETGKCGTCQLIERNLEEEFAANEEAARRYGVRAVPTIVIDERIKVEGMPNLPWMCSDDFYRTLEQQYPLTIRLDDELCPQR